MTFSKTLTVHLDAIQNRDLETFTGTLAADGKLTIILPNGSFMNQFEEIVEFHRQWFADPDWSLILEEISRWQTEHVGSVVYRVIYNDLDPDGKPYHLRYLLNLTFIYQEGRWLLVHDQNTMLSDEEGS
ncbi:MAG: hypothetical protein QNJ45_26225 [Ardenticatenaceae bacterium]|nr:hypothetical protein [Ardenticatenaceae bacterium]